MRRNLEQFERSVQCIIQSILETQKNPQKSHQKVRLELIRLIQRAEELCISCGVPAGRMRICDDAVINRVLMSNYVADAMLAFREYFTEITAALEDCGSNKDVEFSAPVSEYVAEHYREDIHLKDIAQIMGFSEGYFARSFRRRFGMSFVDYLTQYRIDRGKRLLEQTEMPIEQVAYRVGYNNYSYFCTCFKKRCGVSPGAYRKQAAEMNCQGNNA